MNLQRPPCRRLCSSSRRFSETIEGFSWKPFTKINTRKWEFLAILYRIITLTLKKNTLRGLHYQLLHPQGKLVYVISGEIFDVAVDIRRGSPSFGKWTGVHLSAENKYQLYIPEGFAHGFLVLSETADVLYKCTEIYTPDDDYGILWSDPAINITWQSSSPILSKKDQEYQTLKNIPETLLPLYKK